MPTRDFTEAVQTIDPEPIADLTLDLLKIWSPPGNEGEMAQRVAAAFEAVGVAAELDSEIHGSPSVVARLGDEHGPTLQWHGHLDAIDVKHTPPRRDGDLLIGRGAADMKGPLAAMIAAAGLVRERGLGGPGRLLITFHGLHESGGNESLKGLIARGIHGDAAITAELGGGTELPVGGLGLSFWEAVIERPGMAIHETVATTETIDPVEVGRLLHGALAELRTRLADRGSPSLFIGQVSAGDYFNRVPNRAVLRGSRRHDVDETLYEVGDELRAVAAAVSSDAGASIEMAVTPITEAYSVDEEAVIVESLRDAHQELTGVRLPSVRSRVATNAYHLVTLAGIPTACYGPDHATNHSDREVLPVSELARLAAGFALASARWFEAGGEPDP